MEVFADMALNPATGNVLLAAGIALQSWIVRELYALKNSVALLRADVDRLREHQSRAL